MPLMMLDLDNTLVDRDDAFRRAVAAFLAEHALPESDLDWVMSVDASGYTPRQVVAESLTDRYRLPEYAVRPLLDGGAQTWSPCPTRPGTRWSGPSPADGPA